MTNKSGHIASTIIAFVFAALLVAAWLPSGHERNQPEGPRELERIIRQEIARKSEIAPYNQAHAEAHGVAEPHHGTALPSSPHLTAPPVIAAGGEKSVEPDKREIRNVEGNTTLMNGFQIFFCLSDIVLIGFAGLIWWNTWSIRKAMDQLRLEAAEQTREAQQFSRAAASMESLVKTATSPGPSASSPASAPVKSALARKKKVNKTPPADQEN